MKKIINTLLTMVYPSLISFFILVFISAFLKGDEWLIYGNVAILFTIIFGIMFLIGFIMQIVSSIRHYLKHKSDN